LHLEKFRVVSDVPCAGTVHSSGRSLAFCSGLPHKAHRMKHFAA
jgi:hypothetical protein